jgi:gluconolactonase
MDDLRAGAFSILVEDLDHPEGVVWSSGGVLYAGGEAGQIYEVTLDGDMREVATTGGSLLGLTMDGDGRIYACDCERLEVVRVDPRAGTAEAYSALPMTLPNASAFDAAGNLYVTDSGDTKADDGRVIRIAPGGEATVWCEDVPRYPNGVCLSLDGTELLVVESYLPGVSAIPILPDGSAGAPRIVLDLPGTVPDGIALDAEGTIYVACYRPDRILRARPGADVEVLADDWEGIVLNAPTNLAFAGPGLDVLVTASVGETQLASAPADVAGFPLVRPRVP